MKTYYEYMKAISSDEIYDRLIQYGLFSEKLPPIFDCEDFLLFCKNPSRMAFSKKWYPYVTFDSYRNINIPRTIGIPTPMAYERQCACIKDNWDEIVKYFEKKTSGQTYKKSRTHIRKMKDTKALFKMNYSNWKTDESPEVDLRIGKKYLVKADIAKCFPSIYTHAIPWALLTKRVAKQTANDNIWQNCLDEETRDTTNGETHGLLIGPHSSNILSEIVLCAIDKELSEWDYLRHIDDYSCYVETKDDADRFLIELNRALREYGLSLNHKKTEIVELPIGSVEKWVNKIKDKTIYLQKFRDYVDFKEVQSVLDFCIGLMTQNKNNASIILYGIKTLQSYNLTTNAKKYIEKTATSLALLYPYLIPSLDEFVYSPFSTNKENLSIYLNKIYDTFVEKEYFESIAYALYLATKYGVEINSFDVNTIIEKHDCILSLCCLIYCRHFKLTKSLEELTKHAKSLKNTDDFEEQWVFAYECLKSGSLKDEWTAMKKAKVSFLKKEYQ